jgi:hypothetical protein
MAAPARFGQARFGESRWGVFDVAFGGALSALLRSRRY